MVQRFRGYSTSSLADADDQAYQQLQEYINTLDPSVHKPVNTTFVPLVLTLSGRPETPQVYFVFYIYTHN